MSLNISSLPQVRDQLINEIIGNAPPVGPQATSTKRLSHAWHSFRDLSGRITGLSSKALAQHQLRQDCHTIASALEKGDISQARPTLTNVLATLSLKMPALDSESLRDVFSGVMQKSGALQTPFAELNAYNTTILTQEINALLGIQTPVIEEKEIPKTPFKNAALIVAGLGLTALSVYAVQSFYTIEPLNATLKTELPLITRPLSTIDRFASNFLFPQSLNSSNICLAHDSPQSLPEFINRSNQTMTPTVPVAEDIKANSIKESNPTSSPIHSEKEIAHSTKSEEISNENGWLQIIKNHPFIALGLCITALKVITDSIENRFKQIRQNVNGWIQMIKNQTFLAFEICITFLRVITNSILDKIQQHKTEAPSPKKQSPRRTAAKKEEDQTPSLRPPSEFDQMNEVAIANLSRPFDTTERQQQSIQAARTPGPALQRHTLD